MKLDQQLFHLDQVLDPISKRDKQQLQLLFLQSRITKDEAFIAVFTRTADNLEEIKRRKL